MSGNFLTYNLGKGVEAFSSGRDASLPYPVIQGHQVHGCRVAVIDRPGMTRAELEGYDAFVTALGGVAIGVRTADCVPVLLWDPAARVVAAVHAGWKGTVLHISKVTISLMCSDFGCRAGNMRAAIGPVGEEVVDGFAAAGFPMQAISSWQGDGDGSPMSGGWHIDLFEANRWLLQDAGLPPQNIFVSGIDTYTSQAWYSARRQGPACGRNINSIRLSAISE